MNNLKYMFTIALIINANKYSSGSSCLILKKGVILKWRAVWRTFMPYRMAGVDVRGLGWQEPMQGNHVKNIFGWR